MLRISILLLFVVLALTNSGAQNLCDSAQFASPDMKWRPVPLWFWNNDKVTEDNVKQQFTAMIHRDGYGGCAILPFGERFAPEYLSDEYMKLYEKVAQMAQTWGAQMSLYDEYGFPSGSMGAINGNGQKRFMDNHPGHTLKRLDKVEYATVPGMVLEQQLSTEGKLMAVVAMDKHTGEVRQLSKHVDANRLIRWQVPLQGEWTVMAFQCVIDGDPNVDYLCAESVKLFIEDTHQQYLNKLPRAFGETITSTFFDEPTLYRAQGRVWTDAFNRRFRQLYKCDPDVYYPALWYDIGPQTAVARNMLFGTRAILYAEGFMKTIADWAENHGIESTGHQDQEEIANPVSVAGDLMLCGKYMTMPGIDKIGGGRPTEDFYKVVSSSANNWDKTKVMAETYGDMGNISVETMYRIAIEQYTKGINNLIPHAVWYNDRQVTFLPELSSRNELYKEALPSFNKFLSRLNYVLSRPGRHVADVAVLYPIHTLQAGHHLDGEKGYYAGGVDVPKTDYPMLSRLLTDELGVDFTYLHPEVLDDRCDVQKGRLVMKNKVNTESFGTIILPSVKVVSLSNMKKVFNAWKQGARVIFTTQLPQLRADLKGSDSEIRQMVDRMLSDKSSHRKCYFVEALSAHNLRNALPSSGNDVTFGDSESPVNYLHKIIDGKSVYYFGNIDHKQCDQVVKLRGKLNDCRWFDPHTGESVTAECTHDGDEYTMVHLTLEPAKSVFLIGE